MIKLTHRTAAAVSLAAFTALALPAFASTTSDGTSASGISVVERFRTYSGERTPSALTALFSLPAPATVHQQPEIALSDGSTVVNIVVTVPETDKAAPNFAVKGAQLLSSQYKKAGEWLLEVLPDKASWNASLVMISGAGTHEYRLTVAPPLPSGAGLGLDDFINFLETPKAGTALRRDLNNDGKRDYLDDYIYTANFLVRKQADPHDPQTRNQRAREMTPARLLKPPPAAGK